MREKAKPAVTSDSTPADGSRHYDVELAIIGAGPAGVAAALAAADCGVRVALIDSAPEPGGQFYRQPARRLGARRPERLYHEWSTWEAMRARLEVHETSGMIRMLMGWQVWTAERYAEDGQVVGRAAQSTELAPESTRPMGRRGSAAAGHSESARRFVVYATGPTQHASADTAAPQAAPRTDTQDSTPHTVHDPAPDAHWPAGSHAAEPAEGKQDAPTGGGRSAQVTASGLVLATGGYEYVLPFPGWTLPGVVTAGGAQAMLKAGLVLPPGRRVVVAGTGPLLLPVATTLAEAGADVVGLFDATSPRRALPHIGALTSSGDKVLEGLGYGARLLRRRVPVRFRRVVVRAEGDDRLTSVVVARLAADGRRIVPGSQRRIACDALAVSHGMLPHTELASVLGARVTRSAFRQRVAVDDEQRTSVDFLWAAGEATGVGGAALALAEGEIAGRSAAARLRGGEPDRATLRGAARTRVRLRSFSAAVDRLYRAPGCWPSLVTDETLLCRCEEMSAGAVREAVRDFGATDLRSVKLLTRAGMGWCQGRMCSAGVAGVSGCELDVLHNPFARPVPLGVLSGCDDSAYSHPRHPHDAHPPDDSPETPNPPEPPDPPRSPHSPHPPHPVADAQPGDLSD
jgi:NADPH-dependent 2,4-dienoyl-CoA reductase/sulfur reductase-like enzyme